MSIFSDLCGYNNIKETRVSFYSKIRRRIQKKQFIRESKLKKEIWSLLFILIFWKHKVNSTDSMQCIDCKTLLFLELEKWGKRSRYDYENCRVWGRNQWNKNRDNSNDMTFIFGSAFVKVWQHYYCIICLNFVI